MGGVWSSENKRVLVSGGGGGIDAGALSSGGMTLVGRFDFSALAGETPAG